MLRYPVKKLDGGVPKVVITYAAPLEQNIGPTAYVVQIRGKRNVE